MLLSRNSRVRTLSEAHYRSLPLLATPRVQCYSLGSLEFEHCSQACCRSPYPWLRIGYSVALLAALSSGLVPRLAVARHTLGYASGTQLLSRLSRARASMRGSLSLATPLATPREQCCSLGSLELEPGSEARYHSLHPRLSRVVPLAMPRLKRCPLSSLGPRSE